VALQIDGALAAAGYKLPLVTTATSGSYALAQLRQLNALGAATYVQQAAISPEPDAAAEMWHPYQAELAAPRDRKTVLVDAPSDPSRHVAL
jgi:hypothetical protein